MLDDNGTCPTGLPQENVFWTFVVPFFFLIQIGVDLVLFTTTHGNGGQQQAEHPVARFSNLHGQGSGQCLTSDDEEVGEENKKRMSRLN